MFFVNGTDFKEKYYNKEADQGSLTNFPKPVNYSYSTVHIPVDVFHEGIFSLHICCYGGLIFVSKFLYVVRENKLKILNYEKILASR